MIHTIKRYIILSLMFILICGQCQAVWLSRATSYNDIQDQFAVNSYTPDNNSTRQVTSQPFEPLMGETFNKNPFPVGQNNSARPVVPSIQLGTVVDNVSPAYSADFGGGWESNLRYADGRSSIRVPINGTWTSVNTPWLIK